MNGMNSKVAGLIAGLAALYVAEPPAPAQAHIDMFGAVQSRGGDEKTKPCGGANRGAQVYTFEPGATISLGISEQIPHDGYFRISFDNDGIDGFKDPQTIDPVNPNRYGTGKKCQGTAKDQCGKSDFCNQVSHNGGAS